MSSTDVEARKRRARGFFDQHLLPAARQPGTAAYFPLGPDAAATTYYIARETRAMQPADFEAHTFSDAAGFARSLAGRWRAEGDPALPALEKPLAELAAALKLDEEQTAEVSELIYVMF